MLILVILIFGVSLLSCSNQEKGSVNNKGAEQTATSSNNQSNSENQQDKQKESTTESKYKLTIEDIKAKYTGGYEGKLVNTTLYFEHYVLAEYTREGKKGDSIHYFDWYNLETGDKDVLPVDGYEAKLVKAITKDNLLFTTNIVNINDGNKYFPQVIQCLRQSEIIGNENDFLQVTKDYYLPINQGIDMGLKTGTLMDMQVSNEGVEVKFGPIKGDEIGYYAGYETIPPTKITYNKAGNQLIIEFKDSVIGSDIKKSVISSSNRYVKSVYVERSDSKIILTINLEDATKYYTAHILTNNFPTIGFRFLEIPPNYE